jgi:hypothetical protein
MSPGAAAAGAADGVAPVSDAGRRRAVRRGRFRQFVVIAHAVTALIHVPITVAATLFMPPLLVVAGAIGLFVATTLRIQALVREERRPRWRTVLLDEPALVHWCASLFATLLFPICSLMVLVAGAVGRSTLTGARGIATAALASYLFAWLVAAWGVWGRRRWVRVSHVDIPMTGLAPGLDGYRVLHVTDLHIGNHDSKARGLEWAARANGLEPDLVVVTGDLVTTGTVFYEDVADVIGAFRAPDGVLVSLGNHDQWDPDRLVRVIEARGPTVLRNASRTVRREGAELVIAGIDDRMTGRDDLELTLAGRPEGAPTILLSHYPDFFVDAALRGVDLVLSGHTHGGQIAVPFMARRASLSRLARQPAHGLHVRGRSRLYVNAGLGTTGPPVRLGVAPEIAVLVLRRP